MAQGKKPIDGVKYVTKDGSKKWANGYNAYPENFPEYVGKYTPHELAEKLDIDLETPRRWEKASGLYLERICKRCGFRKQHSEMAQLEPNPVCGPCKENPPRTSEQMMRHFSRFTFPIPKGAHA